VPYFSASGGGFPSEVLYQVSASLPTSSSLCSRTYHRHLSRVCLVEGLVHCVDGPDNNRLGSEGENIRSQNLFVNWRYLHPSVNSEQRTNFGVSAKQIVHRCVARPCQQHWAHAPAVCVSTGVYPDCNLCGLCYDSVASRIDRLAVNVQRSYLTILHVWINYYRQFITTLSVFVSLLERPCQIAVFRNVSLLTRLTPLLLHIFTFVSHLKKKGHLKWIYEVGIAVYTAPRASLFE